MHCNVGCRDVFKLYRFLSVKVLTTRQRCWQVHSPVNEYRVPWNSADTFTAAAPRCYARDPPSSESPPPTVTLLGLTPARPIHGNKGVKPTKGDLNSLPVWWHLLADCPKLVNVVASPNPHRLWARLDKLTIIWLPGGCCCQCNVHSRIMLSIIVCWF